LNTVVLDGIAKGRQPSLLLVAVTSFGVVAAAAVLGGAVLVVPELVPLVEPPRLELPPLDDEVEPPLDEEVEPPLEPVPFAGVVVPPDVLLVGGVVVPVAEPVVVLSAVDAPELAALLEPQALSAVRQTSEIAGKNATRSFDAKIIDTCFHSLSRNHAECR
jgi:hypothetical protein